MLRRFIILDLRLDSLYLPLRLALRMALIPSFLYDQPNVYLLFSSNSSKSFHLIAYV